MLRRLLIAVLIIPTGLTAFAQEERTQSAPSQTSPPPTDGGSSTLSQAAAQQKQQNQRKPLLKEKRVWLFIGGMAAIGATGGYLISHDGAGHKTGGGVLIGIDGIALCVAFVPGCSR